jgi:hypothetical protein
METVWSLYIPSVPQLPHKYTANISTSIHTATALLTLILILIIPTTTNLEEKVIVDAPGNDVNASMPE